MNKYSYTQANFLHADTLDYNIKESALAANYTGLHSEGLNVIIEFSVALTAQEETDLDALVADHDNNGSTDQHYQIMNSQASQAASIAFGDKLLHDWMRQNQVEGITIEQSAWVFSRFEEYQVNFGAGLKHIDMIKLLLNGAIPTAYYSILGVAPDDMTQPYHWLTQARVDWFKSQMEDYLGADTVASIQALYSTHNP